jgi:hypothetical protein
MPNLLLLALRRRWRRFASLYGVLRDNRYPPLSAALAAWGLVRNEVRRG